MAGERLAKMTMQVSLADQETVGSPAVQLRALQTGHVRFKLAGAWMDYYRGGSTQQHQFTVPDPVDVGRDYVKQAVDNLIALIRLDIQTRGIDYLVSDSRDLGNDLITNHPKIEFDITATQLPTSYDLDFQNFYQGTPNGWQIAQNLRTLYALTVVQNVVATGAYGSATGSINLSVFQGNTRPLVYTWADIGAASDTRTNLTAGSYVCVVSDQDGVSATVTCVVTSDAQLAVLVQQTASSITLVVSGGLPPYAVAWDDGPTSLERLGLTAGTYQATVSDARGASQRVKVVLAASRCYYSQNPIRFDLDAGAAYRLDPTTKPNLSFLCQVYVEVDYLSGTYVAVGPQLEQPADAQGRTSFEVSALLDPFVAEHLPEATGSGVMNLAGSLFRRFYLRTAEKFGTPPVAGALSAAQPHTVLLGGLGAEQAAAGTWLAYQAAVKPFLTWDADYPRLLPRQPYYLYYQHLSEAATVQVWLRVHHLDGTSTSDVLAELDGLLRYEVYCLRLGPTDRGLAGAEVLGYDAWLTDEAGTVLSETRHVLLERRYFPQQRFVLYTNSLGGVNVLPALGEAKLAVEVTALEAPRPAYLADLGDVATLDRQGQPTLSVYTGPRRRQQVYADQELLLSRRVTLLADGQYWPARVNPASYVVKDEAEGVAALSFDLLLARQRHFSPRLPAGLAGQLVLPVRGGEGAQP